MNINLTCPRCTQALTPTGNYLRCGRHGLFFRYGPRLLLRAPVTDTSDQALLPWETLADEQPALLELPTATAATPTE